jgi:L-rhamnose isomerase
VVVRTIFTGLRAEARKMICMDMGHYHPTNP